ncbi:MAG: Crp/Fnr family transcriptional regulator [Vicinamibacterales bacterium]
MINYLVDFAYILQLCGFITRDVLHLRTFLFVAQATVSFYAWRNGVPAIAGWNVVLACVNAYMASRIILERRAVALPDGLKPMYERHFSALTPAEFMRWWGQGRRETVRDASLARVGEQPDWLYFLLRGTVRVARDKTAVTELPAGYFVAEMSLLTGQAAIADVDALGEVEVMRWDRRMLLNLRQQNPILWTKIQSVIGHDLVEKIRLQETRAPAPGRA